MLRNVTRRRKEIKILDPGNCEHHHDDVEHTFHARKSCKLNLRFFRLRRRRLQYFSSNCNLITLMCTTGATLLYGETFTMPLFSSSMRICVGVVRRRRKFIIISNVQLFRPSSRRTRVVGNKRRNCWLEAIKKLILNKP